MIFSILLIAELRNHSKILEQNQNSKGYLTLHILFLTNCLFSVFVTLCILNKVVGKIFNESLDIFQNDFFDTSFLETENCSKILLSNFIYYLHIRQDNLLAIQVYKQCLILFKDLRVIHTFICNINVRRIYWVILILT